MPSLQVLIKLVFLAKIAPNKACPEEVARDFAPDAGESAQIPGSFLRLFIFHFGRRPARPSAGTPYGDDVPLGCASGQHLHRTAFPGTARQGRYGAVQV